MNKKTLCQNKFSPIHFACFQGDAEVIRLLHKYGADIDVKNEMGLSPMHVAAQNDKAFSIAFLYEHGIDVDCEDNEGQTPLHWACFQGAEEAIYYLLAWTKGLN